jgi:uncharacterized protein
MTDIIVGLIVGVLWGYILYKAMVCDHGCIVGGLALKNMNMLLVIMTSVVTTGLIIYPLNALEIVKLIPKPTYVVGNVVGGALLGIGMAIAGYCPGTAFASIGAGKKDAAFAILGGLVGALIYPIIFPIIKPILVDPLTLGKITVPGLIASKLGIPQVISAYIILALFIGAIIFMARLQKKYIIKKIKKVSEEGSRINI